ncbi:MAG: hypothetical protein M1434_14680 [Chloroflexi bacterium]|nr:hypothetical protein [Chloroflexota bacterium]MCL5275964.1 hypothetical protein [Chloroflexota bacterium]
MKSRIPAIIVLAALLLFAVWFMLPGTAKQLEGLTGEQARLSQLRGLWNLLLDLPRQPLQLAPDANIQYVKGISPFGVNTFLEQEVEVAKRERSLQMIKDSGYTWIRQQFPWADIEIDGKGDFTDRRNPPARSAWDKYDNIVALTEKYGLQMIARLSAPPQWAHAGYADLGDFGPPANFQDYADFVAAVVSRYKGRIHYYQIWNEPNIYPEWGQQRVNPEDYTKMLCMAYQRAKQIDPEVVIISAALAPTVAQDGRDLSDLIFLQRMYNAGAGKCFDILSAQGYGLFSGPDDHRLNPLTTNVARHVLLRDIMVRNGDEDKSIWLSELNWDAVPGNPANIQDWGKYGTVTEQQQASYVPATYDRAKREWPWVGVMAIWFFKRASDSERNQSWYYFRMLEPDFAPTPLYESMKRYMQTR